MTKLADCINCDGIGTINDAICPVCHAAHPGIDTCATCGTTGYVVTVCPCCQGTKTVSAGGTLGKIRLAVEYSVARCPAYVILENTDSTEYANLDANKKSWYNLFISAGILDMTEGTKSWDLFLSWIFPSGTSHTAILAALAAL